MDGVAASLGEVIARRIQRAFKDAQARNVANLQARALAGDQQARLALDRMQSLGLAPATASPVTVVPTQASRPAPSPAPATLAAPASKPALVPLSVDLPDAFPALPLVILEEDLVEPSRLLSAFSGAGLLSGIVLAEALAKPLSLRENGTGGAF